MALFYLIQLWAHLGLLLIGLWLNRANMRMFILTAAVGTGFYAPIQATDNPMYWYLQCFLVDFGVAFAALGAGAGAASTSVLAITCVMMFAHVIGMVVGPQSGIGPYRVIIPILELAQFLVCIFLSKWMLSKAVRILNHHKGD